MRLTGLLAAALIAMGIAAAGASAGDDDHPVTRKDRVAGTGTFLPVTGRVHVNAKSGPAGENPSGRFRVAAFGTINVRGEVTCLNVQGDGAFIGGEIRKGQPDFALDGVRIEVRDNQGRGRRVPDEFNFDAGQVPPPTECPPPGAFALLPVDRGNFTVHDGLIQGPPGGDEGGDGEGGGDGDDGGEGDDSGDEGDDLESLGGGGADDLVLQSELLPGFLTPPLESSGDPSLIP